MSIRFAALFCASLGLAAPAAAAQIIEFDAPADPAQHAWSAIDAKGEVVGSYFQAELGADAAFVRKSSGAIVAVGDGNDLFVEATAGRGLLTGVAIQQGRGFVASLAQPDHVTYFDVEDAVDSGYGTQPFAINADGAVAGIFGRTADLASHGFVRHPDGSIETFDGPLADIENEGTQVRGMNKNGDVVGWAIDSGRVEHPFIRLASGKMKKIKLPNESQSGSKEQHANAINAKGEVAGAFTGSDNKVRGFMRDKHGAVAVVDIDQATATRLVALNDKGAAAGFFLDSGSIAHGFVREPGGAITIFDAPDALVAAGFGTFVNGINDKGEIAGYYPTSGNRMHFFLRKP